MSWAMQLRTLSSSALSLTITASTACSDAVMMLTVVEDEVEVVAEEPESAEVVMILVVVVVVVVADDDDDDDDDEEEMVDSAEERPAIATAGEPGYEPEAGESDELSRTNSDIILLFLSMPAAMATAGLEHTLVAQDSLTAVMVLRAFFSPWQMALEVLSSSVTSATTCCARATAAVSSDFALSIDLHASART